MCMMTERSGERSGERAGDSVSLEGRPGDPGSLCCGDCGSERFVVLVVTRNDGTAGIVGRADVRSTLPKSVLDGAFAASGRFDVRNTLP